MANRCELGSCAGRYPLAEAVGDARTSLAPSLAIRDPPSAAPGYPADLHKRGVEGATTVGFVVDSTGLVDLSTVIVIAATSAEFIRR